MMELNTIFFELIRVSIGTQEKLSRAPSSVEWAELYQMSRKQSLVGICFAGVQKILSHSVTLGNACQSKNSPSKGENPDTLEPSETSEAHWNLPELLYLRWMGMAAKIQQRNEVMNGYTERVRQYFDSMGVPSMILKGQAVATLYGDLRSLRQSGDVDVWVKMSRKELFDWSRKEFEEVEGYNGLHIHCPFFRDAEVEVHFKPGYFSSPFRNKVFRKLCCVHAPTLKGNYNIDFNLVYILQHCYNHLCGHGVGLRQIMDYYFVLINSESERQRQETMEWIQLMGMTKFCKAVMWILKEYFGMKAKFLLCAPDKQLGQFLLSEIMATGNMGHHDERVKAGTWNTAWGRYKYKVKRSVYLMRICPLEWFWRPITTPFSFIKKKIK